MNASNLILFIIFLIFDLSLFWILIDSIKKGYIVTGSFRAKTHAIFKKNEQPILYWHSIIFLSVIIVIIMIISYHYLYSII